MMRTKRLNMILMPDAITMVIITARGMSVGIITVKVMLKNPYVQAVLRGLKPCMIGIILATGVYMIIRNGIVIQNSALLIRPLILTLVKIVFGG